MEPGTSAANMVLELLDAGEDVLVLDNLSTGFQSAVPDGAPLIVGDVGDQALVRRLLKRNAIDAIIHFAGSPYGSSKLMTETSCAIRRMRARCAMSRYATSTSLAPIPTARVDNPRRAPPISSRSRLRRRWASVPISRFLALIT